MNKRDQIPQLFYIVHAYNSSNEIIKSIECRGITKQDAARSMGRAMEMLWHCKDVKDVKSLWAHQISHEEYDRQNLSTK